MSQSTSIRACMEADFRSRQSNSTCAAAGPLAKHALELGDCRATSRMASRAAVHRATVREGWEKPSLLRIKHWHGPSIPWPLHSTPRGGEHRYASLAIETKGWPAASRFCRAVSKCLWKRNPIGDFKTHTTGIKVRSTI